ncbi:prepilin-type N-terminal cleavage/methylation domain-containing protein [Pseudazoarcus pumilus]|nr:prepilin-type N-terminal cleavage/methylation domain-containing protein [Pseudazoarcus pumilus]
MSSPHHTLHRQRGLTLIELMIALVLGLLVVLGVISVVVANSQAYRTNEGLSQVQEAARTGFEVLARRIREAGTTGCGNERIANTVNDVAAWWQIDDWESEPWPVIRGYDGNTAGPVAFGDDDSDVNQRVPGTGALLLQGLDDIGVFVVDHNPPSAQFEINVATPLIDDGDVLLVCDFDHAAIFQVTNYNSTNRTVVHNTGTGTPGNCSKGLGFPTDCEDTNGNAYSYGENSMIFRLAMEAWYIGFNGRPAEGGRSLFRQRLGLNGTTVVEEMVAGVTDMQLAFREENDASFAATPGNWNNVNAVELTLTVASTDARVSVNTAVDQGRIARDFTTVVALRNRLP